MSMPKSTSRNGERPIFSEDLSRRLRGESVRAAPHVTHAQPRGGTGQAAPVPRNVSSGAGSAGAAGTGARLIPTMAIQIRVSTHANAIRCTTYRPLPRIDVNGGGTAQRSIPLEGPATR